MIGNSAYPLKLWPFAHNTDLTSDQRNYNYRMRRTRITVEIVFGQVALLMKRNDMNVDNIPMSSLLPASFTIYVKSMENILMILGYRTWMAIMINQKLLLEI